ncbi:lysophospholipid acyltransferase family protein [Schleiferia thermophila]|uniref:1-acyl-sn-glycerol-3-phosphate acyltransferase n=1 Tax=Schleiferia thermophila TaxID=884107 RepID=A0A369A415_9FLAO|nr:lysophospholipid acyltransferase family protein [Schleiferia thermophila]RCX03979.1 1-acyl-sn-glycerol-3-phosphate acyltransferase [Schleiferia thermophila]GCD80211.1 1-acyl-sn-glycerol-3-phosphate acyltransferase [Schleiferia thermophila]
MKRKANRTLRSKFTAFQGIMLPFRLLWRLWFYLSIFIAIAAVFPFILVFSLKPAWYRYFFRFERIWAYIVLLLMGFIPVVKNRHLIRADRQYIITANHTSMIDIMMTLIAVPNVFLFIGKKELASYPLFGYFYRRTNILVDRKSYSSKKFVYWKAAEKIAEGYSVCIYPEGGVPNEDVELAPFKIGAFKLAVETSTDILPISFPDNKKHFSYNFLKGHPGILRAIIHPPIEVSKLPFVTAEELRDKTYSIILSGLPGR